MPAQKLKTVLEQSAVTHYLTVMALALTSHLKCTIEHTCLLLSIQDPMQPSHSYVCMSKACLIMQAGYRTTQGSQSCTQSSNESQCLLKSSGTHQGVAFKECCSGEQTHVLSRTMFQAKPCVEQNHKCLESRGRLIAACRARWACWKSLGLPGAGAVRDYALQDMWASAGVVLPIHRSPLETSPKGHFAAVIVTVRLLWGSGSCWGSEVLWIEAAMDLVRQWIPEFQSGDGPLFDVHCIQKEAVAGVIPCSRAGSH